MSNEVQDVDWKKGEVAWTFEAEPGDSRSTPRRR